MSESMTPEGAVDDAAIDAMANILGDMPLEEAQEPVEAEGQEVEEATEEVVDETEVVEGDEPETEEVETEEDDGKEEEGSEEPENYSLETIAEAWEMDPKEVGNLITGKQKVNGEWVEVTFNEALENFSRQSDYTAKTQALVDRTAEIEKQTEERFENLDQMHNVLAQIIQQDMADLQQEKAQVNWQELEYDPAQYAMTSEKFRQREQHLNQRVQAGMQAYAELKAKQKELLEQKQQEDAKKEMEVMIRDIPGWDSEVKRNEDMKTIAELLVGAGYAPEELFGLTDSRSLKLALELSELRKMKADTPKPQVKRKKVKILKPGVKKSTGSFDSNTSLYANKMKRYKKTGSMDDAAEALAIKLNL